MLSGPDSLINTETKDYAVKHGSREAYGFPAFIFDRFVCKKGVNDNWRCSTCAQMEGNSRQQSRLASFVHLCLCVTALVKDTNDHICSSINMFAT